MLRVEIQNPTADGDFFGNVADSCIKKKKKVLCAESLGPTHHVHGFGSWGDSHTKEGVLRCHLRISQLYLSNNL